MNNIEQPFHGDRPIESPSEDRLGFGLAASHVAEAINTMASPDGFVIGIEGDWGSGKSSFINLVSEALRQPENAPEIIRFLPWLISSREGLLKELFTEITKAAIRIDSGEAPLAWWQRPLARVWPKRYSAQAVRKQKLKLLFSRFSSRLVQAGKLAELFGLTGAGAATEAGTRSINEWLGNSSLEGEKAKIQYELRKLERKIIVFIDDLDRLEPDEVAEILRLVRAVVDFSNIVFVLCYSREIIASNLAEALHIKNGDEFLEKIVQVSFSVPRPEAFDLRRMFRHDLQLLYPNLFDDEDVGTRSIRDRLAYVIDDEGSRALLTPRHVIRAMNALRFHATPVFNDIDIADMVWLQLIRLQSLRLHQWIEGYLIEFAARHAGARISEESRNSELRELKEILDEMDHHISSRAAREQALISSLPGVDYLFESVDSRPTMVLGLFGQERMSSFIRGKRLGSPQHFRYYFALTLPQNAISDRDFSSFLDNARNSPEAAVAQFTSLATTLTAQGRLAAHPLMDRLKDKGIEGIAEIVLPVILDAFVESMDSAALIAGKGDWGEYWIWRDAENLLKTIWLKLGEHERNRLAVRMFGSGKSIGWLTQILRGEIYSHGIYGTSKEPESEWILSGPELDIGAKELIQRFHRMTSFDLDRLPRVAPLLYAWMEYEPDSLGEIQAKVAELSQSDEAFVKLLQGMRSWQATNGVVQFPLKESNLSSFMNVGLVRDRLKSLTKLSNAALARQANELLDALIVEDNK